MQTQETEISGYRTVNRTGLEKKLASKYLLPLLVQVEADRFWGELAYAANDPAFRADPPCGPSNAAAFALTIRCRGSQGL